MPLSALAVSCKITAYTKDIRVQTDGAALVQEAVRYAFDGLTV